jgi:alpha-glucosidase
MADFERLVGEAHRRGLRVILDLVLNHTSNRHPWFEESRGSRDNARANWYIWRDPSGRDGRGRPRPPNNWVSYFGGSAWAWDRRRGQYYLHTFLRQQPDLNWREPVVQAAQFEMVHGWLGRGVDGFRLDAIDKLIKDEQLRDDPPATATFPLPLREDAAALERVYSGNRPEAIEALGAIRAAAGDALLVGEVFQPTSEYARYLEVLDLVFAFEFLFSPWKAKRLNAAIGPAARLRRVAWVMSNHDFDRLATRVGPESLRAAAMLLLGLPGAAFIYQGDEIGLANGPGVQPPFDRAGRDPMRHPMQWDASPTGGFTSGEAWLEPVDPAERNVEAQRDDPGSLLQLYRLLIEARRLLGDGFRLLEGFEGIVTFERPQHVVAINVTAGRQPAPVTSQPELTTHPDPLAEGWLAPHAGVIARKSG